MWIVPLLSWYHEDWDTQPDVDAAAWRAERDSEYHPEGYGAAVVIIISLARATSCLLPYKLIVSHFTLQLQMYDRRAHVCFSRLRLCLQVAGESR